MTRKEKHKIKIIEYCGDPNNEFPTRSEIAVNLLGYSKSQGMYRHFTPDELDQIEQEAWLARKSRTVHHRARLYDVLFREAQSGNVQAIREYLDRTEGKVQDKLSAQVTGQQKIILKWKN